MPLALTCDELGGLKDAGKHLLDAWDGIRGIIVLATKSKPPEEELTTALMPHMSQTQEAVKELQSIKVDREWDRHLKALTEMCHCLSWPLYKAPKMLPANCAKDAIGSAEYWTNKIRKDFKDDEAQQDFCSNVKKSLTGLVEYIEKYHKTGLTFNPRGVSLAEAAVVLGEPPEEDSRKDVLKSPMGKRRGVGSLVGGNLSGLVQELASKRSADGSSAATGLRHVSSECFVESNWLLFSTCSFLTLKLSFDYCCPYIFKGHKRQANLEKGIQRRRIWSTQGYCGSQPQATQEGRKSQTYRSSHF